MFSFLLIARLALITMPSFSIGQTHFYDEIGFPAALGEFSSEPLMVNKFSFTSSNLNKRSGVGPSKKHFGMDGTSQDSIQPSAKPTPVPYSSFFKNAPVFLKNQSQKGNGIEELSLKVSELINTLDDELIVQTTWLENNSKLLEDCQTLAQHALLEPQRLSDMERLWAIGIWAALENGRQFNPTPEIQLQFLIECNTQVNLEIHAASGESIYQGAWGSRN